VASPLAVQIRLTACERKRLKKIAGGHKSPARDKLRAQSVLDAARGLPNAVIARRQVSAPRSSPFPSVDLVPCPCVHARRVVVSQAAPARARRSRALLADTTRRAPPQDPSLD
jgi:hypothetical protein